jgi:hypothetical protein
MMHMHHTSRRVEMALQPLTEHDDMLLVDDMLMDSKQQNPWEVDDALCDSSNV